MAALTPPRLCSLCKGMERLERMTRDTLSRSIWLESGRSRVPLGRPYSTTRANLHTWTAQRSRFGTSFTSEPSSYASSSRLRTTGLTRTFTSALNPSLRGHQTRTGRRSYATAAADYYKVLKVPQGATRQQIKAKFYELSKRFHPDAPGGSTTKFHAIGEAYEVLGDDAKRREYDRTLSNARYTSYQAPASSYAPYATNSRRPAGPHQAWSASGRTRPPPPPGARSDPFASPSPEPGQYGGPLFGQGYQPFGQHDSRKATFGDYSEPFVIFNLSKDPRTRQGKKELEEMERLFAAAFRDPFNPKYRELRDAAFAQAKSGQSGAPPAIPSFGFRMLFWSLTIGFFAYIMRGGSRTEDRGEK